MGFFKKKADPISDRSRELTARIASLESEIKRLNRQAQSDSAPTIRIRSTAYMEGGAVATRTPPAHQETVFEKVDQRPITSDTEAPATPQRFNELGLRKYDLFSWFQRARQQLKEPPPASPKWVNYLAAGSLQGLRPLRYEKRVARRRFIVITIVLALVLLGIFLSAMGHR